MTRRTAAVPDVRNLVGRELLSAACLSSPWLLPTSAALVEDAGIVETLGVPDAPEPGVDADRPASQIDAYRLRVLMMRFDKNRDGRFSQEELTANRFLSDRMDSDKDGIVTPVELAGSNVGIHRQAFPEPTGR